MLFVTIYVYAMIEELLVFNLENQRFALPLSAIERVIRAQAITTVSNSPAFIEGVIDYNGEVIAVISLRTRFSLPAKEMHLDDRIIVARTARRKLALLVDVVEDVLVPQLEDLSHPKKIHDGLQFLHILRDDRGIILIYDLENVLSGEEDLALQDLIETTFSFKENV